MSDYQRSNILVRSRRPIADPISTPTPPLESLDGEEAYEESSSSINTSGKMSNESSYENESFKVNTRDRRGISPPDILGQKSNKKAGPHVKPRYVGEGATPKNGFDCSVLIWPIAVVVVLFGLIIGFVNIDNKSDCTFEELSQKYYKQNGKIWDTLSSGINNIKNKQSKQSGVYLFVAENGSKMEKIVKSIAEHTSKCFDEKFRLIEMTEDDFTSQNTIEDYGNVIEKFKEKLEEGRVALIVNLNKIPAESARALHFICDTYNPVAADIVIYLTLVVPSTMHKPTQAAQNMLTDLWGSKLKKSELDPLITRVTDEVIAIK
ncbi:unnamed protein product [Ceratitis capitata]|uniref:(Mediterranean fruit fly) hypothetical protein n=1 Tax=Ceratitis capitata TaxID=7213 RepID=A0A811V3U6_CERCA|nr:unnamed protein product [Ceratitis capitata]